MNREELSGGGGGSRASIIIHPMDENWAAHSSSGTACISSRGSSRYQCKCHHASKIHSSIWHTLWGRSRGRQAGRIEAGAPDPFSPSCWLFCDGTCPPLPLQKFLTFSPERQWGTHIEQRGGRLPCQTLPSPARPGPAPPGLFCLAQAWTIFPGPNARVQIAHKNNCAAVAPWAHYDGLDSHKLCPCHVPPC